MPLPVSAVDGGLSTSTNNGTGAAKLLSRSVAAFASHADNLRTCRRGGELAMQPTEKRVPIGATDPNPPSAYARCGTYPFVQRSRARKRERERENRKREHRERERERESTDVHASAR